MKYDFYPDRWREYHPELRPGASELERLRYRVDMHQRKIAYHERWRKDAERQAARQRALRAADPANWERRRQAAVAAQAAIQQQRLKAGLDPGVYASHPLNKAYMRQVRIESEAKARAAARSTRRDTQFERQAKSHARAAAKQRVTLQKNLARLRALKSL